MGGSKEASAWEVPLYRVQVLADVIFGIAMVRMAAALALPDVDGVETSADVLAFLRNEAPLFGVYAISFVLVAIYWLKHLEHFSYLEGTNVTHLWLELGFLASVVLIPWTNGFVMAFPASGAVKAIYSANMVAVGLFAWGAWTYATTGHRLVAVEHDAAELARVGRKSLVEPALAVAAVAALVLHSYAWDVVFMGVPIAFAIQSRRKRRQVA